MMTPAPHYRSLQGCRAAAAMLVVLFHLGGTFAQQKYFGYAAMDGLFAWGDAGVDFFFVLSGFLITTIHRADFGHPQALPRYLVKRVVRIYPTYWLICLAVCAAALVVPALRQALPTSPLVFAQALALLPQDPDIVGGTGSPILFVAWSLQYEVMFYAVIAIAILSRAAGALIAGALLLVNLGCGGDACAFPLSFIGSNMVFLFAMGAAAAYVVRSDFKLPKPRVVAAVAGAAFVGFGAFELWIGRDALVVDRRLVFGALAALLIVALAQAEDAGVLAPKHRWFELLGDSSYALYLLHIPVISVLVKVFARFGFTSHAALWGVFCVIFLACVVVSLLFHMTIERRLLAALRFGAAKAASHEARVASPNARTAHSP